MTSNLVTVGSSYTVTVGLRCSTPLIKATCIELEESDSFKISNTFRITSSPQAGKYYSYEDSIAMAWDINAGPPIPSSI